MLNEFLNTNWKAKLSKGHDSLLLKEYDNLRRLMWSKDCTINPLKWQHTIRKVAEEKQYYLFTGDQQNDLPEFLLFLIDTFNDALARPVEMTISGSELNTTDKLASVCYKMIQDNYSEKYSEIFDLFFGVHVSEILSLEGKSLSMKPESFMILDLAIPNKANVDLYDCIKHHYLEESLSGENAWFNEKTNKKEDVKRHFLVWSFPKILIISLKRFFNPEKKKQTYVDFPIENLDLSSYVSGYHKCSYKYDLFAVCNHSGVTQGGHYTASIKKGNDWYEYNDTFIQITNKIVTRKSYCLFYKKKNNTI
tara:strand:- start:920 stop:1840 length:921 start_codon:yes stop_codon:yes gene_type:complete